jgi:O-antigen/teichoic acid export membrane protein
MVAYSAVVVGLSAHLVPWIYGDRFTGTQHPLIVLAIAWAITGATLPAARALLVIKRPDQMLWAQLAGIGANVALGVPMTVLWGAAGAAYAALAGSAVKGALSYWWYAVGVQRLLTHAVDVAPVVEEVHSLAVPTRELGWAALGSAALAEEAV